ncbi:Glycosyl hydrolases family 16 [Seminavis robusta]|uniref:Glycosyl hydrolases family 16 n=1 Tax=Seminavis robusta TaxID=568900 RepID=A0A9N8D8L2_9STRA|nr:Glycosyl hydrolases family 16 [Seminavis robusta]|eukprot:Sro41_g025160.1 Glycosyl hydrolases family 16 (701) ;mRNA; r:69474-71672
MMRGLQQIAMDKDSYGFTFAPFTFAPQLPAPQPTFAPFPPPTSRPPTSPPTSRPPTSPPTSRPPTSPPTSRPPTSPPSPSPTNPPPTTPLPTKGPTVKPTPRPPTTAAPVVTTKPPVSSTPVPVDNAPVTTSPVNSPVSNPGPPSATSPVNSPVSNPDGPPVATPGDTPTATKAPTNPPPTTLSPVSTAPVTTAPVASPTANVAPTLNNPAPTKAPVPAVSPTTNVPVVAPTNTVAPVGSNPSPSSPIAPSPNTNPVPESSGGPNIRPPVSPTPNNNPSNPSTPSSSDCSNVLLWGEEFNYKGEPDPNIWSYDLGGGGWGNHELQTYTSSAENVVVQDDRLKIAVRNKTQAEDTAITFTSARIKTDDKFLFTYGTLEARIKAPDIDAGLWPALWTLGSEFYQVGWPAAGEIDIFEMGQGLAINEGKVNRRVVSAAHWAIEGEYATYARSYDHPTNLTNDFHIYRMEWNPNSISTYVDDNWVWEMDIDQGNCPTCGVFHKPHFILLNIAVGGGFTSGGTSSSAAGSSSSSACYGSSSSAGASSSAAGSSSGGCPSRKPEDVTAPLPAEMQVDWIRLYDNCHTTVDKQPPTSSPTDAPVDATVAAADRSSTAGSTTYDDAADKFVPEDFVEEPETVREEPLGEQPGLRSSVSQKMEAGGGTNSQKLKAVGGTADATNVSSSSRRRKLLAGVLLSGLVLLHLV